MSQKEVVHSKLEPLKQWYCDSCGDIIKTADEGWLEWYRDIKEDNFSKDKEFRIVHRNNRCMYDSDSLFKQSKLNSDMHLIDFTCSNGLVYLLSKIQYNDVEDNAEIVEIIRRLHVPYYEEARQYHSIAEEDGYFDGENEITRYTVSMSKEILNRYNS